MRRMTAPKSDRLVVGAAVLQDRIPCAAVICERFSPPSPNRIYAFR
jgi:hypothetical protein